MITSPIARRRSIAPPPVALTDGFQIALYAGAAFAAAGAVAVLALVRREPAADPVLETATESTSA